jgi:hypothetical protein
MITGQHDPAQIVMPSNGSQGLTQDIGCRGFGIEGIAGQQDNSRAILPSLSGQPIEDGVTRLAQAATQVFGQITEALAYM